MAFSPDVLDAVDRVAAERGIEAAALRAVVEIESGGRATSDVDGRPMPLILYEYHVFHRWPALSAANRAEAVRQRLAAARWGDIPYPSSQSERYALLRRAAAIDEQAAHAACSWGVGQVLGENAEWLGFGTPRRLAERAMEGVEGQLAVMLAFIERRGLLAKLAAHDWRGFTRVYNGPGQVEAYSGKIAAAYRRHAGREAVELDPRAPRLDMKGGP
ncbi:N-acetylmuramidase domain-containing protein [Wenxinia marina]|uniref:N-acetylmuramidase domain-containing protein n=1 Tax=Wenxinia marina DSM 24838 TaxID=1123501 RepID=A0A0D0QA76_9RHOB|nr:N-acetylmuramidase domain-containing protein [Wenxinia marina]KIQ71374.1 hypothetical protein Wenmar_00152 [Wenxinia marina DSM 24838]GGL81237.1 peptidoglycan-binding protein [Wenxinia marina]